MTIRNALQSAIEALEASGVPDPRTDAELLVAHCTEQPRLELWLQGEREFPMEQERRLASLLLSRCARKPLQYLLGEQGFYGLSFSVDERVLIPRPETETLCELAIRHVRALPALPAPRALDLCTGSGAIAVTLAGACPHAAVTAADVSGDALAVARRNAEAHRVALRLVQGDLFAPVAGERFDLIACNPPYIPSGELPALQPEVRFEPSLALDGGGDGLAFYRRIAREAAAHLTPGGLLCLETGDAQTEAVAALLAGDARLRGIAVHPDLSGSPRVVCAFLSPT